MRNPFGAANAANGLWNNDVNLPPHRSLTPRNCSTEKGDVVPDAARPGPTARRLDRKLAAILARTDTPDDFILADAKDADMAWGLAAAGPRTPGGTDYRTRTEFLAAMRAQIAQGDVDIMLASASNAQVLATTGALDDQITLAVRANDSTDVWSARGGGYAALASRPFRSVHLPVIRDFCDLVLYSVTLNNDVDRDLATLTSYRDFRTEAADLGIAHFLEVFNPNAPVGLNPTEVGAFVNDSIVRTLAGVTAPFRPRFLKVAYNGAAALAELAGYDDSLVVGILGGAAGTTRDTFELLTRAQAAGARVALFGRKIQRAESQLALVTVMRMVLRGEVTPAEGVRVYHDRLAAEGVAPTRDVATDAQVTDPMLRAE
jgi:hypothetical protein